jgi:hypothetical protein
MSRRPSRLRVALGCAITTLLLTTAHAAPADATWYGFKIQGAGRIHDHLAVTGVPHEVGS